MAVNRKAALQRQRREVNDNFKKIMRQVERPMTERTLTMVVMAIQTRSAYYVPQDTTALINSNFRDIIMTGSGMKGVVGYTQNYAAALENRTDWSPRAPADRPSGTGAYNPNAQPGFLTQGADDAVALDMQSILLRGYKL